MEALRPCVKPEQGKAMHTPSPIRISMHACASEAALGEEAARLAALMRRGDCIRLEGNLGAGKTSFARAAIQSLSCETVEVISPTFTLVQSYPVQMEGKPMLLSHADLYRIENAADLEEIGIHELHLQGALLVEWPQIAADWLPPEALTLRLSPGDGPGARLLEYLATPQSGWQARLRHAS